MINARRKAKNAKTTKTQSTKRQTKTKKQTQHNPAQKKTPMTVRSKLAVKHETYSPPDVDKSTTPSARLLAHAYETCSLAFIQKVHPVTKTVNQISVTDCCHQEFSVIFPVIWIGLRHFPFNTLVSFCIFQMSPNVSNMFMIFFHFVVSFCLFRCFHLAYIVFLVLISLVFCVVRAELCFLGVILQLVFLFGVFLSFGVVSCFFFCVVVCFCMVVFWFSDKL